MKTHLANWCWKVALLLILIGSFATVAESRADNSGPQLVAETRQALRQQGFKTDLAEFNFSTSPELRAREAILKAAVPEQLSGPSPFQINLMEAVSTNSAIVLWKEDLLKLEYRTWPDNRDKMSWDTFRKMLNRNQSALDAACAAILSGPIAFDLNAREGAVIRLPHLAMLKNLTQTLGCRVPLDVHDGNQAAAWTNLIAVTRLVTAWQVEPVEISELVRFNNATVAYDATWQALQSNGWSDEQLARLQQEWELANFFTNLPEIDAFKRSSDVALCGQDRQQFVEFRPNYKSMLIESLQSPQQMWQDLLYIRSMRDYFQFGMYQDQTDLLLFYRDREIELRNAIQAPTWMQMRQLPGVTNKVFFQSKYRSRLQSMLNLQEMSTAFLKLGTSCLGHAAEAEARRRILITAIAVERYHKKYGSYPNDLTKLAPEFLKTVPLDFMDGHPLRYRLTDGGQFLIYSVGLDCVDDGGKILAPKSGIGFPSRGLFGPQETDIVWPLSAFAGEPTPLRQ